MQQEQEESNRRVELERLKIEGEIRESQIREENKKEIELAKISVNERVELRTLEVRGNEHEHNVNYLDNLKTRLDLPPLKTVDRDELDRYLNKFE